MGVTVHIADWFALELAFSYNAPDKHAFLDLRTGEVRTLQTEELRDDQALRNFAEEPDRFVRIEPVPPRDQHRWMVKFAAAVEDGKLRARLDRALSAPGAFRAFKDALRSSTDEWRRWRSARSLLCHQRILAWLAEKNIVPDAPPPWHAQGESVSPGRSDEHSRLLTVAHDYLGKLSPAKLELAVTYLRHVYERHHGE